MKNINLLIVEDEQDDLNEWKRTIPRHNLLAKNDEGLIHFNVKYASTLKEAKSRIKNFQFDAAIVDIRLKTEDDEPNYKNTDGIDVFNEILKQKVSFVTIYTGQSTDAQNIDPKYDNFIKTIKRTEKSKAELLKWLSHEQGKLLEVIVNLKAEFSSSMATLFHESIWPRWEYWLNGNPETNIARKALTRHMATHLHASFLNEVAAVHPEEYYFIPPLQNRLDTGDIIHLEGKYYILVTPRCDLAREKNPTFQLAELADIKAEWDNLSEQKTNSSNRERDKVNKKLKSIVNHGDRSPKLHFIPQFKLSDGKELGPFHAQFNFMRCLEATEETRNDLSELRVATLSNEFVPSLVERLGAYFSRIGTPDYSHPE